MGRNEEFNVGHALGGVKAYLAGKAAPGAKKKPPPLFHGTAHDPQTLYETDTLFPSSARGPGAPRSKWADFYTNPDESWRADRVFATEAERSAWTWAQGPNRPRVHEVELARPSTENAFAGEWHGSSGRIKSTQWAPPPKKGGWVQPSLPPLNWEQHGGRHWTDNEMAGIEADIAEERKPPPKKKPTYAGQQSLF